MSRDSHGIVIGVFPLYMKPDVPVIAVKISNFTPVPRHEAMIRVGQVSAALARENFAINARVAQHHFQSLLEIITHNLAVLKIRALRK